MLACVAISTSFIISNSYILCLLISSDGLASLTCLSFFFFLLFLGGEILPSSPVLISWAGMHHCTASASYFFQLREWSSGGRARSKCEGENLATFTCRLEPAAFSPCLKIVLSLSEFICLSAVYSKQVYFSVCLPFILHCALVAFLGCTWYCISANAHCCTLVTGKHQATRLLVIANICK